MKYIIYISIILVSFFVGYKYGESSVYTIKYKLEVIKQNSHNIRAIAERNNKIMEEIKNDIDSLPSEILSNIKTSSIK